MKSAGETTQLIIGVDEAGRGPLAGPVMASAVILDPDIPIDGLNDSKHLTEKQRDHLAPLIRQQALAWSVAAATVGEIETLNILQATLLAMRRAVQALCLPDTSKRVALHVQVDGNRVPDFKGLPFPCTAEAIVDGDALIPSISAASILAKVERDAWMQALDQQYPVYGFARHKGYGTAAHLQALRQHGVCPEHRRSFAPIRALIA